LLEGVDSVDYAEDRRILAPGDRLLFYSDGLTDAIDPGKRPFGEDRLLAALAEPPGRPLPDALQHLVARVDSHTAGGPPLDDVTVLGVEVG
jgi:sigma-B regulation protein RsbU (phosphoserine phosphatase)